MFDYLHYSSWNVLFCLVEHLVHCCKVETKVVTMQVLMTFCLLSFILFLSQEFQNYHLLWSISLDSAIQTNYFQKVGIV